MTTEKQIAANRRNAKRSTGPRTEAGKAIASRNNTQHGLYANATPIIPGHETAAQWEQHRAITLSGLNPATQLEEALAERVALILWRLGRVARYERHVTTNAQTHAPADLIAEDQPDHQASAQDIRDRFVAARRALRALTRFQTRPPDAPLTGLDAETILESIAQQVEEFDWATFAVPGIFAHYESIAEVPGWTIARVQHCVDAIAATAQRDAAELLTIALATSRARHNHHRVAYRQLERQVRDLRHQRIVPQARKLDNVIRYEGHLTRQLAQTLNQLQQLQRHRQTSRSAPADDDYHRPVHYYDDVIAETYATTPRLTAPQQPERSALHLKLGLQQPEPSIHHPELGTQHPEHGGQPPASGAQPPESGTSNPSTEPFPSSQPPEPAGTSTSEYTPWRPRYHE